MVSNFKLINPKFNIQNKNMEVKAEKFLMKVATKLLGKLYVYAIIF